MLFGLVWLVSCAVPTRQRPCKIRVANIYLAIALVLTITNTVAFSRCDRFSQASNLANRAFSGGIVSNLAGGMLSRLFR